MPFWPLMGFEEKKVASNERGLRHVIGAEEVLYA